MVFIYNALFILISGYLFEGKLKQEKVKRTYLFICFFQMFLIQGLYYELRHYGSFTGDRSEMLLVWDQHTGSREGWMIPVP